jgi:hypothetical protein
MGENARQDLVDQQMLEGAGWKRRFGTAGDRPTVVDEERRESRKAEAVGITVARARQGDTPVRRSPVVIPPGIFECVLFGRADSNPAVPRAAFSPG